jgi:ABC-2 type transport system permease protein
LIQLYGLVRKDLQLFFADRRAVLMAFAVPIAIASFFGSLFSGGAGSGGTARIPVVLVDEDGSAISTAIAAGLRGHEALQVAPATEADARARVRRGATAVAIVVPAGFGAAAGRAFFTGGGRPQMQLLYDPSHGPELAMVRGILTEYVMRAVSHEMFTGESGRRLMDETLASLDRVGLPTDQQRLLRDLLGSARRFYGQQDRNGSGAPGGFSMPYTVREEAVTARSGTAYNGYAHSFAGMGVQFLLFATTNLGIEMLLERQRGLWRRLRSAPISRTTLLGARTISGSAIALLTLWVSFAFAMIVFRVRIQGSVVGFVAVSAACAVMAATFGVLVAAVGRTPAATRGVTAFAVLILVMLGGAWVPAFVFPRWLQQATLVVPVRWSIDGLDAMTWRGLGLGAAVVPTLVQLGFATLFAVVAVARFRWEEA